MTNSLLDSDWINQLSQYDSLWVGLSGGLDSVVLLNVLASQPILLNKLSAVHIHHGLSMHADAWVTHCQGLCDVLNIPLVVRYVTLDTSQNIEEQAREARLTIFSELLLEKSAIILAHHADDQAETLLLQLLRGAGIDGLGAMPSIKTLGQGKLIRPFLNHTRDTLQHYALSHQISWVDDDSNENIIFSRNYLRHQVMPILKTRWPGMVKNFSQAAQHCQQAQVNLNTLALLDGGAVIAQGNTLSLAMLHHLDVDRIGNILRYWLKQNAVKLPSTRLFDRLISDMIMARQDANPTVRWDHVCVKRYQNTLYLLKNYSILPPENALWPNFPKSLELNQGTYLLATLSPQGMHIPKGSSVEIRYRQGGELFYWHGQHKHLKKLFQAWQVPPWSRDTVPLIYINHDLAAVVGFAISDHYFTTNSQPAYQISLRDDSCHNL